MSFITQISDEHQKFLQLSGGKVRIKVEPNNPQDVNKDGFVDFLEYLESSGKFTRQQIEKAKSGIIGQLKGKYLECIKEDQAGVALLSRPKNLVSTIKYAEEPCKTQAFDLLRYRKPSEKLLYGLLFNSPRPLRTKIALVLHGIYKGKIPGKKLMKMITSLPINIATKLLDKVFATDLSNKILLRLVSLRGKYGDRAANKLLAKRESLKNEELVRIIKARRFPFSTLALKTLLDRKPPDKTLVEIIWEGEERSARKAFEYLSQKNLSKKELIANLESFASEYAVYASLELPVRKYHDEFAEKLWKRFLSHNPTNSDFVSLLRNLLIASGEGRVFRWAFKEMMQRRPTIWEAGGVFPNCMSEHGFGLSKHYKRAAQYILARKPVKSKKDDYISLMIKIIKYADEPYKYRAFRRFLGMKPGVFDLKEAAACLLPGRYLDEAFVRLVRQNVPLADLFKHLQKVRRPSIRWRIIKKYVREKNKYPPLRKLAKVEIFRLFKTFPSIALSEQSDALFLPVQSKTEPRGEDIWPVPYKPKKAGKGIAGEIQSIAGQLKALKYKMVREEDIKKFKKIYFNPYFRHKIKGNPHFIWVDAVSVAVAVLRFMEKYQGEDFASQAKIKQAVDFILAMRSKFAKKRFLDRRTKMLYFTGNEKRFDNTKLEQFAKESNVPDANIVAKGLKAHASKSRILEAMQRLRGKSYITYEGHGMSSFLALAAAEYGITLVRGAKAQIHFKEMGDVLARSGNCFNSAILISSCYSYNFAVYLLRYLRNKGVMQLPAIVTVANKNLQGFGGGKLVDNLLLEGVMLTHKPGKDLLGQHYLDAEKFAVDREDPAFFMPVNKKDLKGFSFDPSVAEAVLKDGYVEVS